MIIEYKIDENDHLAFHLYTASKSKQTKKRRFLSTIIISILYGSFGLFDLINDKYVSGSIFLSLAILWYFLYPIWDRKRYIKHYNKFIKENYSEAIGRLSVLEIKDDFILSKDNNSESKTSTKEISEINEIPSYIFIKLKNGLTYVLPKDKISDYDLVKKRLHELSKYLNLNYNIDENWKWR